MIINKITIQNFRSVSNFEVNFNKDVNIISGKNGSGKTSVLEAIFFALNLTTFRSSKKATIKEGEKYVKITLILNYEDKVDILYNDKLTKVFINNEPVENYKKITKFNKIIFFNPFDFNIILGSMSAKRKMLNFNISQVVESYVNLLSEIKNENKIKTKLLKENSKYEILYKQNEKIANLYKKVYVARENYINEIKEILSSKNKSCLYYSYPNPNLDKITKEECKFKKNKLNLDIDKLYIKINEQEVKNISSRGEIKRLIFDILHAQSAIIKNIHQENAVILIDDLHSELDLENIEYILNMYKENQIVYTKIDQNKTISLEKNVSYETF